MPSPESGGRGHISFDYTKILDETLTFTDSISSIRGITLVEEFFTIDDSFEANWVGGEEDLVLTDLLANSLTRILDSETITLTDSIEPVVNKAALDTITLADTISWGFTFPSETITLTDAFTVTGWGHADILTLTDTHVFDVFRVLNDEAILTDILANQLGRTLPNETITLSDTIETSVITIKNLEDTLTLSDSIEKVVTKPPFVETITLADTIAHLTIKVFEETLSLVDSVLAGNAMEETETLSFTDSVVLVLTKVLTETVALTDDLKFATATIKEELITLSDSSKFTASKIFGEIVTLADDFGSVPLYAGEILSLVDSAIKHTTKSLIEQPGSSGGGGFVLNDSWPYSMMMDFTGGAVTIGGVWLGDSIATQLLTGEGRPFITAVDVQPVLTIVRETDPEVYAVKEKPEIRGVFGNIQV